MSEKSVEVVGGVDTHRDVHVAAAVAVTGQLLGTASFPATRGGYGELLAWPSAWGEVARVGSRAPAATAPAWRAISPQPVFAWWR